MDTQTILKHHYKQNIPTLQSGQVVRVSEKIVEGNRERVQVFEGLVIAVKHGNGLNGTFTVRKMALGRFGVEKVFLLHQPSIQKIEILRQEKVRRAKLYFMRDKVNKKMKKRKTKEINSAFDLQMYTEDESVETEAQEQEQETTQEAEKQESEQHNTTDIPEQEPQPPEDQKSEKEQEPQEQESLQQKEEEIKQDAQTHHESNPQEEAELQNKTAEYEKAVKEEFDVIQEAKKEEEEVENKE